LRDELPATGYSGLSLAIRVQGIKPGGTHTRFRAVGHHKGSKQLLNTSAGLVPTVVRNELIVARSSGSVQRTNNPSEFFRTRFGARGEPTTPEQLEQMNQEFTAAVERAFRSGGESFFAASRTYDVRRRRSRILAAGVSISNAPG